MFIYKITNKINGKAYIGQTKHSIEKRFEEHCRWKSTSLIHRAILKYGKENFSLELLSTGITRDELNNAETHFIAYFVTLSPNGYNLDSGGKVHGQYSEITLARMSKSHIGKPGPWRGKKLSEEHKKKFVDGHVRAKRGVPHSKEHRAKLSAAHKGKKMSEEACLNMSNAHKGKFLSEETKKALSIASKGRRHSEESKAKMRQAKAIRDLQNSLR